MGEAMSESGVFAHAKARALLEVVRLAFEGGIGFDKDFTNSSYATVREDPDGPTNIGLSRPKLKHEKDPAQHAAHLPHRPASTGSSSRLVNGGPCMWCGVTATPQWRRPRGTNKLLCNACGIFFTRYGKLPDKTHHAHVAVSQTAGDIAASSSLPGTPLSVLSAQERRPAEDEGNANQAEASVQPAEVDAIGAAEEHRRHEHEHRELEELRQGKLQPQTISRRRVWTCPLTMTTPHKRKGAPQPGVESMLGVDDRTSMDMRTEASPAPAAPAAVAAPFQFTAALGEAELSGQPQPLGLTLQLPGTTMGGGAVAAAVGEAVATSSDRFTSTMLTVAPLELGLQQKISQVQYLGLLGSSLTGLGALPAALYLHGSSGSTVATAAAAAGSYAANAGVHGLGSSGLLQSYGYDRHNVVPFLPLELLAPPFPLPVNVMPIGAALVNPTVAATAPQPYVRPAKRQERHPAGESDDSNVSTDSHAAAMTSHDEDEGGTATTGPKKIQTPGVAAIAAATAGTSSSSTAGIPCGVSCSPPALPAGAHFPSAIARPIARPAAAVPLTLSAATAGGDNVPLLLPPLSSGTSAAAAAGGTPPVLVGAVPEPATATQMLLQQQSQFLLLETRRSKGPRTRATSVTPTSSMQS